MTIIEVIKKVLREEKRPLNHKEIYQKIIDNQYYSFGAKDPVSVVRGEIRKHCYGIDFPSASPKKVFSLAKLNNKESLPRYEIWNGNFNKIDQVKVDEKETIPEEIIYKKYQEHLSIVKAQLLDYIKSSDPAFFEKLVVELLLKMGYGWNGSSAGMVLGGAGDEGIDGIISEDKLGLEKIYIQAKRYKDNNVQPSHIRDFIGAMSIKGARKGVFFTSSNFSDQAKKHAEQAQNMSVMLINGQLLCDYLVQHEMGVAKSTIYTLYEIDRNFFDEE